MMMLFYFLEKDKYRWKREVEKMSKSKYNVVNPDDICEEYGQIVFRLYEMFLGPFRTIKTKEYSRFLVFIGFLKNL